MKIKVNANDCAKHLNHYWSYCVGAGRANEGLRKGWLEQLELVVNECGFQYLRFHGLFHDDMFVYRIKDGKELYNWQYIDEVFDRMLDIGIRPFIELGFCPAQMASGEATQFWWKGNITPPKDFKKWAELVNRFVKHIIARYGLNEVKSWVFEVWNEPNLGGFWTGGKQKYFALYKASVNAIKAIEPSLKVGGPATSNFVPDARFDGDQENVLLHSTFKHENIDEQQWQGVWITDFINYCSENNLPIDFISTHPYPTDFGFDESDCWSGHSRSVNSTKNDLQWLRNCVDNSTYNAAKIHLTEWNSSPIANDRCHDFLPVAAFVMKTNIDSIGLVDSLAYWAFTDIFEEGGGGASIFHGGFGLVNFQGIVKPTYHSYRFLNYLGDLELLRGEGFIVTKSSNTKKISMAFYNYCENVISTSVPISRGETYSLAEEIQRCGQPKSISLSIADCDVNAKFLIEIVDQNHGCAMSKYQEMGCPEPPTREETKQLKEIAFQTKKETIHSDAQGNLVLNLQLEAWSIASIRQL